jgi:hypothetical protein
MSSFAHYDISLRQITKMIDRVEGKHRRKWTDRRAVSHACKKLGIEGATEFRKFFIRFCSASLSNPNYGELNDLIHPSEGIWLTTVWAREFGLPPNLIYLSTGEGGGGLFYDKSTHFVYDMDHSEFQKFENGQIEPTWKSFFHFISCFLDYD